MQAKAPFTPEQIKNLQYWQSAGHFHPFTCPHHHEGDRTLIPVETGWKCPGCSYTQDWAHDFMLLTPEQDPIAKILNDIKSKKP